MNVLLVNNASYSKQNNEIIVTSNGDYSRIELLFKLEVGKTYFLSTNVTNSIAGRANISIYSLGYTKKYAEQYMTDANGTIGLLFTPEEENIIIVLYSNASSDNDTNTVNFSNIQLEQGSTATDYEEYIEPKIYVKNDNDVYEEFISKESLDNYSTGEKRIGTWIDGKPLYRMVGVVGETEISSSETTVRYISLPANCVPKFASAVIKTKTSNYSLFVNSSYSEGGFKIRYMGSQNAIQIIATTEVAPEVSFNAEVIIEYTKTTD